MGLKNFKLDYFEESFTSENWIVRIYKRKSRKNREGLIYMSKNSLNYPTHLEEMKLEFELFDNMKYKYKIILRKKKKIAV